jgi:hypothetical protein
MVEDEALRIAAPPAGSVTRPGAASSKWDRRGGRLGLWRELEKPTISFIKTESVLYLSLSRIEPALTTRAKEKQHGE